MVQSAMIEEKSNNSRWPQAGDSLFASSGAWESQALLDAPWDWFMQYAMGYKDAADAVVAAVEARQASPDSVGYATCFLYRHYIELMLKGLINVGNQLRNRTAEYPKNDHRIRELWAQARSFLEEACPEGNPTDAETVEKCILEFASIDPSGEASRYGEDTKGNPTFKNATQLSLTNMRDVMNRLSGFLEGSYDYMHELLQYQADVDADSF
jgi:hypothetical protein